MNESGRILRLKAVDGDDIGVLSAALQDAVVPIGDMSYAPGDRQFVFAAIRYRWESSEHDNDGQAGERINCGVTISNVVNVKRRGIDFGDRGAFLSLLSIAVSGEAGGDGPVLDLTFSGEAAIRLETTGLLCHLEDFGEPWPTQWRPRHADD